MSLYQLPDFEEIHEYDDVLAERGPLLGWDLDGWVSELEVDAFMAYLDGEYGPTERGCDVTWSWRRELPSTDDAGGEWTEYRYKTSHTPGAVAVTQIVINTDLPYLCTVCPADRPDRAVVGQDGEWVCRTHLDERWRAAMARLEARV